MKKIIILFLIFSAMAFAEWKVAAMHIYDGDTATTFVTYDNKTESSLAISVVVESFGYSLVFIGNKEIKEDNNLSLIIKDNEGDYISYSIYGDDIGNEGVVVESKRSDALAKMLYKGQSAILYNNDTDKLLATFDLKGLKRIMQKNIGSSYWYKYKLNSIYD